jgi:hypothetical protein
MNREPAFFHGAGKVECDVDEILLVRIAGQDSCGCAGEEVLQILSHDSLRIIEECDHFIYFCGRYLGVWLWNVHEKGIPARAFEIQTL